MRKYIIALILVGFYCLIGYGQSSQSISGKVMSESTLPLEGVTVQLIALPDSTTHAVAVTTQQGTYSLSISKLGSFLLRYSLVGYVPQDGQSFPIANTRGITMPDMVLLKSMDQIEEVTVLGRQPGLRQYADKMVVDIEGSVLAEGNNVLELLEKSPGLVSDGKGNFSIQGRAGANVRIDGRNTYLSGEQLASLLRGMQASDVAKLELMSTPGAKEDAVGTAGVINIVTKRNKRAGFGGTVFARGVQARKSQGSVGGSLHYKMSGFDFYVHASTGLDASWDSTRIDRLFYTDGALLSVQKQLERKVLESGKNNSVRTGISYEFSDGGILDASFHWMRGRFISSSDVEMNILSLNPNQESVALTDNTFDETFHNLTYNINYVNKYDGEDHFLKFNFDYAPHTNDYNNVFRTNLLDVQSGITAETARRNVQDLSNTTYSGRLDYSKPFSDAGKLEMGWKGTYFFIDNKVSNDSILEQRWIRDHTTSNQFQYAQHIEAAYAVYTGKVKQLEYQLGLRGEYTFIKANQLTLDEINSQEYFDLFPSASMVYNFADEQFLRAAFSSRIQRPGDHDINTFRIYQDAFSYSEGNPDLKPERSYIMEIGHGYRNKLFTTIGVSRGQDVINWVNQPADEAGKNVSRPENIGRYENYSLSVMYNKGFASFWTASNYLNGFYNKFFGNVNGVRLDSRGYSWTYNSRNTLHLKWGLRSEILLYYASGITTGANRTDDRYGVDLAAEKKMLGDRAMLKLAFNGLFRNANPRYTSRYGDLVTNHAAYPDNRKVLLSLSYRFGV